jgi:hypothetical protein
MSSASSALHASSMPSMNSASVTAFCAPSVPSRSLPLLATRARLISHASASCAQVVRSASAHTHINPCAFAHGRDARLSVIPHGYVGALPIRASRVAPAGQARNRLLRRTSALVVRGRARWGLTLRSTGPAGTCFDLRSASRRRAGYL